MLGRDLKTQVAGLNWERTWLRISASTRTKFSSVSSLTITFSGALKSICCLCDRFSWIDLYNFPEFNMLPVFLSILETLFLSWRTDPCWLFLPSFGRGKRGEETSFCEHTSFIRCEAQNKNCFWGCEDRLHVQQDQSLTFTVCEETRVLSLWTLLKRQPSVDGLFKERLV